MKYSEAKKQIETLSNLYNIDMEDGDFNVRYELVMNDFAFVEGSDQYQIDFYSDDSLFKIPSKDKLYMILVELAMTPLDERVEENKYYVKAFQGYLNIREIDNRPSINTNYENYTVHTKFTKKEIKQLKKRDDIPLDWNKVTLEEVE